MAKDGKSMKGSNNSGEEEEAISENLIKISKRKFKKDKNQNLANEKIKIKLKKKFK